MDCVFAREVIQEKRHPPTTHPILPDLYSPMERSWVPSQCTSTRHIEPVGRLPHPESCASDSGASGSM